MSFKTILILKEISELLRKDSPVCNRRDLRVITAASNEEALEMHRAEKADLIITKREAQGLSGDRFCTLIRRDRKLAGVSVLMLCENNHLAIDQSHHCGANEVLPLPISSDSLCKSVLKFVNIQEREPFRVLANVQVTSPSGTLSFLCNTVNMSASGLLLETDSALNVGEMLSCSFFLPGSRRITVWGKIVRSARKAGGLFEYGIKFLHPNYEIRDALLRK